ncbi:MAG: sigma-70 family RNA polymerase sigma factor [Pirellulaceae bacterium]|jgi:RNA polymerase sigma factor (TIGR02999 family)|nr:sigma-70 family RNA polymerase sigma factor [Pirellulaceae bacterium]MCU0981842.1 sigma-70 family RNA polymerase sigma factor [Pirellulaceae bacterium]
MASEQGETTRLLLEACQGQRASLEALLPLVYDELKAIAVQRLRGERPDHTLQPTALVHEAFLRMVDQTRVQWQNRAHFCAVAANMMRRILVDHARARAAEKRGAGRREVPLLDTIGLAKERNPVDIVALDDLLRELARLHERHARVVELRFFGGLNVEETAHTLGVSPATVKNDWRAARAWLLTQLTNHDAG